MCSDSSGYFINQGTIVLQGSPDKDIVFDLKYIRCENNGMFPCLKPHRANINLVMVRKGQTEVATFTRDKYDFFCIERDGEKIATIPDEKISLIAQKSVQVGIVKCNLSLIFFVLPEEDSWDYKKDRIKVINTMYKGSEISDSIGESISKNFIEGINKQGACFLDPRSEEEKERGVKAYLTKTNRCLVKFFC